MSEFTLCLLNIFGKIIKIADDKIVVFTKALDIHIRKGLSQFSFSEKGRCIEKLFHFLSARIKLSLHIRSAHVFNKFFCDEKLEGFWRSDLEPFIIRWVNLSI